MNQNIPNEDIIKVDNDLQEFFDSLGPNDIYKRVFLEVLLEEIYGRPVDLSGLVNWDMQQEQQPSFQNPLPLTNQQGSPASHALPKTLPS